MQLHFPGPRTRVSGLSMGSEASKGASRPQNKSDCVVMLIQMLGLTLASMPMANQQPDDTAHPIGEAPHVKKATASVKLLGGSIR